jgi:hypothetical protein
MVSGGQNLEYVFFFFCRHFSKTKDSVTKMRPRGQNWIMFDQVDKNVNGWAEREQNKDYEGTIRPKCDQVCPGET